MGMNKPKWMFSCFMLLSLVLALYYQDTEHWIVFSIFVFCILWDEVVKN